MQTYCEASANQKIISSIGATQIRIEQLVQKEIKLNKLSQAKFQIERKKILSDLIEVQQLNSLLSYLNALDNLGLLLNTSDSLVIEREIKWPLNIDSLTKTNPIWDIHPEMKMAQTNADVIKAQLTISQKQRVPNMEMGIIGNPQNTIPYLGVFYTCPIPIFNKAKVLVQLNKQELQQAEDQTKAKAHQLQQLWKTAIRTYNYKRNISDLAELVFQDTDKALTSVEEEFRENKTSDLALLESYRTYIEAKLDMIISEKELNMAVIQLLLLSGKL